MEIQNRVYVGIDNGSTGTVGIIFPDNTSDFRSTPSKSVTNYQKTKAKNITRIDYPRLKEIFTTYSKNELASWKVFLERPMVNPQRFEATTSALRAFEATLICLEELCISYTFADSKAWQKYLLPLGLKGSEQQKKASKDVGIRLFPNHKELILEHGDADGLLIAEWAKRNNL